MKKAILSMALVAASLVSTTAYARTQFNCKDVHNGEAHTIEITNGHMWLDGKIRMYPYGESSKTDQNTVKRMFVNQKQTVGLVVFMREDSPRFEYGIIGDYGKVKSQGFCIGE